MFRAQIIGNLGADAHVEQNNGHPFVSFSVAHNDRFTREDGTVKETMQWISCAMNGDGGKLLEYLKKGRLVYVEGRATTRVFSSEKERRMVAGVNISVDHLELIGTQSDVVPGRLFDKDGVMHTTQKSYWINEAEAKAILGKAEEAVLYSQSGQAFTLSKPCWVAPRVEQTAQVEDQAAKSDEVEIF